jgi:hypothetical protein
METNAGGAMVQILGDVRVEVADGSRESALDLVRQLGSLA